jgi:hypothetical protein
MLSEYEAHVCQCRAEYEPCSGFLLKLVIVIMSMVVLGWVGTLNGEEAGASTVSQVQRQG